MGKQIKTEDLLDYIETYNKYEYLIDKYIMKTNPEYINNEDFMQDAKLALLDYIKNNEAFNRIKNNNYSAYQYVRKNIMKTINSLYSKYEELNFYESNKIDETIFTNMDNIIYEHDLHNMIEKSLGTLSEREYKFLKLYFFDGLTLREIGEREDICKDRVRQIIARGLRCMRHPYRTRYIRDYIIED